MDERFVKLMLFQVQLEKWQGFLVILSRAFVIVPSLYFPIVLLIEISSDKGTYQAFHPVSPFYDMPSCTFITMLFVHRLNYNSKTNTLEAPNLET